MFLPHVSLLLDMWEWFYVLEYLFRVFLIAIRNHILFITGKDSVTQPMLILFFFHQDAEQRRLEDEMQKRRER